MSKAKQQFEPWSLEKYTDLRCNLCLLSKPLSEDHVPPRCVGNDKPVKIRRFYHDQRANAFPFAIRKVRGGITFKTLCQSCNSLIGQWDPELKVLVQGVKAARRRGDLILSGAVKMGAVVRATLGHILASKLTIDASSPDNAIRAYLLNNQALDTEMRVHMWHW